jgi:multidrug resistance efflux pump
MRLLPIVAGLSIAAASLFVVVGEQLSGVSADAVINARLTTLNAPIAGSLSFSVRELGTRVDRDEMLGQLTDRLVDNIRLNDLRMELDFTVAEVSRLETEIGAIEESMQALRQRARLYAAQRIRQLTVRIEERQALSRALAARLSVATSTLDRSTELRTRGIETVAAFESARSAVDQIEREIDAANAEIISAEIELEAARSGVYLGEGYNDAPNSEQQISFLTVEHKRVAAALGAQISRREVLERRVEEEQLRVSRLSGTTVKSNVRGRLWAILSADEEVLQRGQPVAQLVDCDSTLVTLSVAEGVYNRLAVGDAATFRVNGESRLFPGTVVRLAGSGASSIYGNLAVAPSQRHLERYDVALSVPGIVSDEELDCAIGRTGRVFFQNRPLDFVRRFWN